MGVVYKARHRRMDRLVAVKMISARNLGSPDAVQRFYREVKAAARLQHPNIVAAYDAGESEGLHYLVMELVQGRDLHAILRERGPLPVDQAIECADPGGPRAALRAPSRASFTATSSRATCSWTPRGRSRSSTWASPGSLGSLA